jgi:signal transduction histidine kinase
VAFELDVAPDLTFAMEQQDVEEVVGNLLENAARFARTKVVTRAVMTTREDDLTDGRRGWIEVVVEDDGPGLAPEQIGEALKRGRRLDESKPGTACRSSRRFPGNIRAHSGSLGQGSVDFAHS